MKCTRILAGVLVVLSVAALEARQTGPAVTANIDETKDYKGMKVALVSSQKAKEHQIPDTPGGGLTARPGMTLVILTFDVVPGSSGQVQLGCEDVSLEGDPSGPVYCEGAYLDRKPASGGRRQVVVRFIVQETFSPRTIKMGAASFSLGGKAPGSGNPK